MIHLIAQIPVHVLAGITTLTTRIMDAADVISGLVHGIEHLI